MGRGPLVGRDRELARLQKSWARAKAGTLSTPGWCFAVSPGSGSPGWRRRPSNWPRTRAAAVLELVGSPFHTDAGLHPVRTLLERRCGIGRLTDQAERLRLLETGIRPVRWIR